MQSIAQNRSSANTQLTLNGQQLPIWPEAVRGGPNAILRSALFSGIHSKKRKVLGTQTRPDKNPEGVAIASQDGIEITFAGTQFNQYDADVFFETLHRARRHPLTAADKAAQCDFQGADFLKSIGRSTNNLSYEDLEQSLYRLRQGSIDLKWVANGRPYTFKGSLVGWYNREDNTRTYRVTFAKEILTLFSPASWTQLEWDERLALKGKPLAQWLHSYFSTHAAPFPVSVTFLHEKSGSPTTLLKHFKVELKHAFTSLELTLGWTVTWNRNLVSVSRKPSAAQTRHLGRKAARAKSQRAAKEAQQRRQLNLPPYTPSTGPQPGAMASTRQILSSILKTF
jgi:hypothetical protein